MRTAADFDNFRKRARRELEDARKAGREELLKDLLPVFDNLERGVQRAQQAADVKAVTDGLQMILKQFESTLARTGITKVPTIGKAFDPAVHEAIQQVETSDQAPGTIVAEVQPGYMTGERLVRAAMVSGREAEVPGRRGGRTKGRVDRHEGRGRARRSAGVTLTSSSAISRSSSESASPVKRWKRAYSPEAGRAPAGNVNEPREFDRVAEHRVEHLNEPLAVAHVPLRERRRHPHPLRNDHLELHLDVRPRSEEERRLPLREHVVMRAR